MEGYSYKHTSRCIDHKNEQLMTSILQNSEIWEALGNPIVITNKDLQISGVDYQSNKYGNIDAKLVMSYNLPTFSQELAFVGRNGHWQQGWFTKDNATDKYLYIYAEVAGYENNYYAAKQHFSAETLTKVKAILVDKKKLQREIHKTFNEDLNVFTKELVKKYKSDLRNLNKIRVDENLRKVYHTDVKSKPYVSCSWGANKYGKPSLPERPINIIVSVDLLEDIADGVWKLCYN